MSISVCMAVYNGERFLAEQCQSILKQLGPMDELIISDDHSSDNSLAIVTSFKDERIKIVTNDLGKGCILNFQNACNHAGGDLIFLSDQDDVWMDDKLEVMVPLLQEYDVIVSDAVVVDKSLNEIASSLFSYIHSGTGIFKNIVKSTYYGSCMGFKSSLLKQVLPFPRTEEIGHDLWIGLVAEITNANVLFLERPLIKYRRHNGAFTNVGIGKSERSLYKKLRGRAVMLLEIIKFYLKFKLCRKA